MSRREYQKEVILFQQLHSDEYSLDDVRPILLPLPAKYDDNSPQLCGLLDFD